jgi:hypothetical protein
MSADTSSDPSATKRARRSIGIGLVAVIACLTVGFAAATSQASASGVISAMNGESLSELPASDWNLQLTAMAAHGVQVVRSDADWGTIEPNPPGPSGPSWQFASTDAWVAALASHHLRWQPILDYNNSWTVATSDDNAFASYGQAVALRYGPGGSFWTQHPRLPDLPVQIFEVWNEENAQPWFINPLSYGPLYAATHDAIHAVDPTASVDVGGLADDSKAFLANADYPSQYVIRLLYEVPWLRGHIDGFALHPYGLAASDVLQWVAAFRRTIDSLGESSAPIDITEFGWLTGGVAEEQWRATQMTLLGKAFAHSADGLREVAPYDWINSPAVGDPGDFGFVDESGTDVKLRPAAVAWFNAFGTGDVTTRAGGHRRRSHRRRRRSRRTRKRPPSLTLVES